MQASSVMTARWKAAFVALALLVFIALAIGAVGRARGQPDDDGAALAPVRCHQAADDATLMGRPSLLDLCAGARSAGAATCAAEAEARTTLSDPQIVQLCRRADSAEPVRCFARLDDETDLGTPQRIRYCAASRAPLVAPDGPGDPACLARAADDTTLSERDAARLCRGAAGDGPARCFLLGDDVTLLSARSLVRLCAPLVERQP